MERIQEIYQAKSVLRSLQARSTKRHPRIHENAMEDNANRLRALNGICGQCEHLTTKFKKRDGKTRVILKCDAKKSPLALYQKTEIGELPDCPSYTPLE